MDEGGGSPAARHVAGALAHAAAAPATLLPASVSPPTAAAMDAVLAVAAVALKQIGMRIKLEPVDSEEEPSLGPLVPTTALPAPAAGAAQVQPASPGQASTDSVQAGASSDPSAPAAQAVHHSAVPQQGVTGATTTAPAVASALAASRNAARLAAAAAAAVAEAAALATVAEAAASAAAPGPAKTPAKKPSTAQAVTPAPVRQLAHEASPSSPSTSEEEGAWRWDDMPLSQRLKRLQKHMGGSPSAPRSPPAAGSRARGGPASGAAAATGAAALAWATAAGEMQAQPSAEAEQAAAEAAAEGTEEDVEEGPGPGDEQFVFSKLDGGRDWGNQVQDLILPILPSKLPWLLGHAALTETIRWACTSPVEAGPVCGMGAWAWVCWAHACGSLCRVLP